MSIVFNLYFVAGVSMLSRARTCCRGAALCPCPVRIGIGFNWRTCCRVLVFGGEVYLLTRKDGWYAVQHNYVEKVYID